MDEMLTYVFKSLQLNDAALTAIAKTLKTQMKFNRNVALFAIATAVYAYANESRCHKLEKKIKELRKDLDELELGKAEEKVEADK